MGRGWKEMFGGKNDASSEGGHATLRELLRLYGDGAFDVDETPAETIRSEAQAHAGQAHDVSRHGAIRSWFQNLRHAEARYVPNALGAFREAMWGIVGVVTHELKDDAGESEMERHAQRLREAASGNSTEELRQAALLTVEMVERLALRRRESLRGLATAVGREVGKVQGALRTCPLKEDLDPLTRVLSAKPFTQLCERMVSLCALTGESAGLVFLELDGLDELRTRRGAEAGNEALKGVSTLCVQYFPSRRDVVARIADGMFSVLAEGCTPESLRAMNVRLLKAVREGIPGITLSVGMCLHLRGEPFSRFWERSQEALAEARRLGRNRIVAG